MSSLFNLPSPILTFLFKYLGTKYGVATQKFFTLKLETEIIFKPTKITLLFHKSQNFPIYPHSKY